MLLEKDLYAAISSRNFQKSRDPDRQNVPDEVGPFDLIHCQSFPGAALFREANWANVACELIGIGDLTLGNIAAIMKGIPRNEAFLVIYKNDVAYAATTGRDDILATTAFVVTSDSCRIIDREPTKLGGSILAQPLRRRDLSKLLEDIKRQ